MFVLFHDRVVNFMLPWKPKQGDESNKLLFMFRKAKKTNYIAIKVTKLCILYNMKTSLLLLYRQQHKQNKKHLYKNQHFNIAQCTKNYLLEYCKE